MYFLFVFLDIFHGRTVLKNDKPYFYSNFLYVASMLICTFCAIIVPTSRFFLGVHSLDQLIYGFTLGVSSAIFCHVMVRDTFMLFVERHVLNTKTRVNQVFN